MKTGVDYYPEHWDKSLWAKDVELMAKTGVSVVRIGEFAWSKMEPTEGKYNFTWLDEVIALFSAKHIGVVLCTPTNCPPLWAYEKYPDIIQINRTATPPQWEGVRGHRCYESETYRKLCENIIRVMAQHFQGCKDIVAWQIDNEAEANHCCCKTCTNKFRDWVKAKYTTIEQVNKAYHNDVWSGSYSDWNEIKPPMGSRPLTQLNPAYMLDYARFASDSTTGYVTFQREIIREYFPDTPVTTNAWFCDNMPDYYDMFSHLDFVSYDNYPTTVFPAEEYSSHAFHLDAMRGVKQQPFWVMEELSGAPGCWFPISRTPSPGMIKGYALQAFAHGADTVVQFRWRTAIGGAEMYWHGLIDSSNVPGRRFNEFASLCSTAKKLQDCEGLPIKSHVAVLMSFDNDYAFKLQLQAPGMYYLEQLKAYHAAFTHFGINVDVINQARDLTKYKIVVAPTMYIQNDTAVENLTRFAENGGIVLLTNRSGVHDSNNNGIMSQLPTVFSPLTGAVVSEYDSVGDTKVDITMDGKPYQGNRWCDIMELKGAEAIARYSSEFYSGEAAITRNIFGKGIVYYVGVVPEKQLCRALAEKMLKESGIAYTADLPENVEITVREGSNKGFTFVFNNNNESVTFTYENREFHLPAFGMEVLEDGETVL